MPFTANVIRVLIASPSDLVEERRVAIATVYEWNALHAEAECVVLLPVAWETHATPRSGVRPQAAINEQLVDQSDILVGMFWTKLGTSTGVAPSGTVEEIERFISAGKPALLYFSKRPVDPGTIDTKQNRKLKEFKETTQKNALVGSFDSLEALQETLARHLLSEVRLLSLKNARGVGKSTTADANSPEDLTDAGDKASLTPLESWGRDDYEHAIFLAIFRKDDKQFTLVDDAYRKIAHFSEEDNAITWQAFVEWVRIQFGKGGQLRKLKALADDNPESAVTLSYLGRAYAQFSQHQLAAGAFLSAMQMAVSPEDKAQHASDAINQFHKAKNGAKVNATLDELRKLVGGAPSAEAILTQAVQRIVEAEKDEPFTIALLERHLELNPDDYDGRFQLAFKQSAAGNEAIALHHYYKIPSSERTALAWNNIGATADQLGLPAKAIAAFNRAAEMDETLAMSNLGFKLLNIGFLELAQEQCNKAIKKAKPHPNVGTLVTSLASVEENEKVHLEGILDGVETQVSYLQQLGKAATLATPETIAENWQGPDCELKLVLRGDGITLKGAYEREDNLLAALIAPPAGLFGSATPRPVSKSKHSVSYSGQIRGQALIGELKHARHGGSLLGSAGEKKVFMIFSDDGNEITVFEKSNSKEPDIQIIKRID
jgi:tetratricopeptide (TPR) repeat protein